jgi:hypothetical protein
MRNLSRFGGALAFPTFLLFITGREAKAQFVVSDPPVELQTLAMHIEQLQQYIQEAQTALNTYQHLQLFIRESSNSHRIPVQTLLGIWRRSPVCWHNRGRSRWIWGRWTQRLKMTSSPTLL